MTIKSQVVDSKVNIRKLLRHNEYYDMQNKFDELYGKSKRNENFNNLYDLIISQENILLAYRNIKRNSGSNKAGTNSHTIEYWENKDIGKFVLYIQNRFKNYQPMTVRRVEIPKPNGKTRPLGIPCIEDRFIQQCIKQVLDPICEAKFHPNSYGFRPNRSTEHAILALNLRIN
jgi:retron-type reverse transcriptase